MNSKAQGSIEYLLIIGAAIIVVGVVVISLIGLTSAGEDQISQEQINNTLNPLQIQRLKALGQIEINQTNINTLTFEDNKTYFLSQNITLPSTSKKITTNITIDCLDNTIKHPSDPISFKFTGQNVTIKNCEITNGSSNGGIAFDGINGNQTVKLINSTIENNDVGISVKNSTLKIENSKICKNKNYQIFCSNSTITGNAIVDSIAGLNCTNTNLITNHC